MGGFVRVRLAAIADHAGERWLGRRERRDADLQHLVGVDTAVIELAPDARQQNLQFVGGPAEGAGKEANGDGLVAFGVVDELVLAHLLEFLVPGPCVDRHLVHHGVHIDEPGILEPALELRPTRHALAVLPRSAGQMFEKIQMPDALLVCVIVGHQVWIYILALHPGAGFQMSTEVSTWGIGLVHGGPTYKPSSVASASCQLIQSSYVSE